MLSTYVTLDDEVIQAVLAAAQSVRWRNGGELIGDSGHGQRAS